MGRFRDTMHKPVTLETVIISVIIVALVVTNILSFLKLNEYKARAISLQQKNTIQRNIMNSERQLSDFFAFLLSKVLVAEGEITFEDRLALENKVRSLGHEDILASWNAFTIAETELQAQERIRGLLGLVANKMQTEN